MAPSSRSSSPRRPTSAARHLLGALGACRCPELALGRCSSASTVDRRALELHRDAADGVVLAERVALPVLGHEDAGEVGVAVEARCRTCRTPRAPWPRCRGGGRTATGTVGSSSGTCTRRRTRSRSACEIRCTTTSKRSGSMPVGQVAAGVVGEVVDGGDVEAHVEAVVVAQARARRRRSSLAVGCSTCWPRLDVTGRAVHALGLGRGVGRPRRRSSAAALVDRGRRLPSTRLGDGTAGRSGWPSRCSTCDPERRCPARRAGELTVADLLVEREDGVDAASRARAGSPGRRRRRARSGRRPARWRSC